MSTAWNGAGTWLATAVRRRIATRWSNRWRVSPGKRAPRQRSGSRWSDRWRTEARRPLVSAIGSGLILQYYLEPDAVDPALLSRALRRLLGLPQRDDHSPS